jgi:hypothetical protein
MKNTVYLVILCAAAGASACKTVDQRYYYTQGIAAFDRDHHIPTKGSCWLTPDPTGPAAGSDAIAEEEFTKYIVEKGLCHIVEKSPDDVAGYTWPKDEVCPCGSGVVPCSAQCDANKPAAASAGGGFGLGSLGGGAAVANDNNRSTDKLLERYKKSQLVDKVIVYRIDELNGNKAVLHFRVSDAKANSGAIEASKVYTILPRAEESAAAQ